MLGKKSSFYTESSESSSTGCGTNITPRSADLWQFKWISGSPPQRMAQPSHWGRARFSSLYCLYNVWNTTPAADLSSTKSITVINLAIQLVDSVTAQAKILSSHRDLQPVATSSEYYDFSRVVIEHCQPYHQLTKSSTSSSITSLLEKTRRWSTALDRWAFIFNN